MRERPVPRPIQVHNVDHANAVAFLLATALLGLACPGAALGAVGARAAWQVTRPPILMRWLIAGLGVFTAAAMCGQLVIGWPWRLLAHLLVPRLAQGLPVLLVVRSIPVEMLLGPLLLLLAETGTTWWDQTIHGQEWARYREMAERKRALERGWQGPAGTAATRAPEAHPHGTIRLGSVATTGRPFDLGVEEIAHHIFSPGASGSGKTTTLVCLADGALANGYGVVIIDCKGTGLGSDAKALARRHGAPYTVVDPHDRKSVGYDVCYGDAAAVANKIVGAFSFSGEAEIYKHVAMEVITIELRFPCSRGC